MIVKFDTASITGNGGGDGQSGHQTGFRGGDGVLPARLIALYQSRFYPIAETDGWWGTGFTDWTLVRNSMPQYPDHDQPRVPDTLGYYDLGQVGVQFRQVYLAKYFGISAFCYDVYWFNGRRLFEQPLATHFGSQDLDFPYCIRWQNENWTRTWLGDGRHVLMRQDYSPEDDIDFINYASQFFVDPRYVRINGRPLLVVHRTDLLPSAVDTAERWRQHCRRIGIGDIHLSYVQHDDLGDPGMIGFDSAIQLPPHSLQPPPVTGPVEGLAADFSGRLLDWRDLAEAHLSLEDPTHALFPGVCPGWDMTPRRGSMADIYAGNTAKSFGDWIVYAVGAAHRRFDTPDQRLVFVNAWNDWSAGAYLEPDQTNEFAYLEAVAEALEALMAE